MIKEFDIPSAENGIYTANVCIQPAVPHLACSLVQYSLLLADIWPYTIFIRRITYSLDELKNGSYVARDQLLNALYNEGLALPVASNLA